MPSERLQKPVLVLNASYEPINVCAARRALVLVLKGVASAEEVSVNGGSFRPKLGPPAERDPPAGIPPDSAADASPLAQEHPDARSLHLPILPPHHALRRIDARSCNSAVASRRVGLGESGSMLPLLQQSQRQPDSGRGGNEAVTAAAALQSAYQPAPDANVGERRSAVAEIPFLLSREASYGWAPP